MSLQDLILEQPLILISLALALAPLVVALVFLVISRVRQRRAQQARRHARQAMAAQREAALVSEQTFQEHAAMPLRTKREQPGPAQAELAEAEDEASQVDEEEPQREGQNPTDTVSSAMQALLSDVFRDDEALARYEVLLRGLDEVDAAELALACEQLAAQLRAGRVSAA